MPTLTKPTKARPITEELKRHFRSVGLTIEQYQKLARRDAFNVWRAAKGYTYQDCAKRWDISYNTVFRWGNDRDPQDMACRIIRQFDADCPLVF